MIERWVREDEWEVVLDVSEDGKTVISFTRLPIVRGPLNTKSYSQVSQVLQGSGYRRLVE